MVKSKIKCPKCKSDSLILIELWKGHSISWDQVGGWFIKPEGILEPGDPYSVEAKCICGHMWKIRGVSQIDQIIK